MYRSRRVGSMTTSLDVEARLENDVTTEEPPKKRTKRTQRRKRQTLQTLQARIKYREQAIHCLNNHLKKGTFPKRFKSLRPYPIMQTRKSQAIVKAACQQVESVLLDQMIQEESMKLKQDQTRYEVMKQERQSERARVPRKPKTVSVLQLQQELKALQAKYEQLSSKLENQE